MIHEKVCALCGASHNYQDDAWWENHRANECIGRDGPRLVAKSEIAPMALIKKALRYHNANKHRADYAGNWERVLVALAGIEVPASTLQPFTAAEAREAEKIWHGWREFREQLETIEAKAEKGDWRVLAARPDLEPADYDPNKPPEAAADDEQPDWERIKLHEALREAGPESWVVDSPDNLPDWYWALDVWPMNTGTAFGKVQIAPGHFVFWDGSGPRGRWSVDVENQPEPEQKPEPPSTKLAVVPIRMANAIAEGDWETVATMAQSKAVETAVESLQIRNIRWLDDCDDLACVVEIRKYPAEADELIGRCWISDISNVSMSAAEAMEAVARSGGSGYTETVRNAPEITFVLPRGYRIEKMKEVKLSFYFRKSKGRGKWGEIDVIRQIPKR